MRQSVSPFTYSSTHPHSSSANHGPWFFESPCPRHPKSSQSDRQGSVLRGNSADPISTINSVVETLPYAPGIKTAASIQIYRKAHEAPLLFSDSAHVVPMADVKKALHRQQRHRLLSIFSGPACTAKTAVPENLLSISPFSLTVRFNENSYGFYAAVLTPQCTLSITSLLLESGHEVVQVSEGLRLAVEAISA